MAAISAKDLSLLEGLAFSTLKEVVTPKGIYASTNKGRSGRFHALFGRDTIFTTAFIHERERLSQEKLFIDLAVEGVLKLGEWQGKDDNELNREQPGKIPHEVWEDSSECKHLVDTRIKAGMKPFYVDFSQKNYINWFSNDSTPLWVFEILRLNQDGFMSLEPYQEEKVKNALKWCVLNIKEHDGFAGYESNREGKWFELFNHSWKDSQKAFLYEDGSLPKLPIKDIGVNAYVWAALEMGARYFKEKNREFAEELSSEARGLKRRFNSKEGFLMTIGDGSPYFSDALDGDNKQLRGIAIDPGLALWASVDGECIIEREYIPSLVARLMKEDFFDAEAGIRTYSSQNTVFDSEAYHRNSDTFWPFASGLVAMGFWIFGYEKEAREVLSSVLKGVLEFNSCIEVFHKRGGIYERYIDKATNVESCADQAWTAGVVYYASSLLR